MAEKITVEQRSKNMKAIRSQSKLENSVSKALWRKGHRFRKNSKSLFGKPDLSIKKYKIVIFIDSCFWHMCKIHGNMPKNNQDYWRKKLLRNVERDSEVTAYYLSKDWHLIRVWEHEFKEDFNGTVERIDVEIRSIKTQSKSGN